MDWEQCSHPEPDSIAVALPTDVRSRRLAAPLVADELHANQPSGVGILGDASPNKQSTTAWHGNSTLA